MFNLCPAAKLARVYPGLEVDCIPFWPRGLVPDQPFKLLMAGHILRRKRFEDGIRAVSNLAREYPGLRLDIAGRVVDSTYFEELQQLIKEHDLSERVGFLGPRNDLFELMRKSDALLHTAESEAFGMVIIEAMAVGLQVIAPSIQGPQEILEHRQSGLLVSPGDVPGYAAAVRLLIQNPELARQLVNNARKRVEAHFSAKRMAEEIAVVYSSLVGYEKYKA
jgi:glycosyltransferase involved in cell wall biosynthesis